MSATPRSEPKTPGLPRPVDVAGRSDYLPMPLSAGVMGDGDNAAAAELGERARLDGHRDARALVRLVQCRRCSYPLTSPMTLPCGNSLCRTCLPESHLRENISYPNVSGRQRGVRCPFPDCGLEHSLADCSVDVTLNKVMAVIGAEIARYRPVTGDTPILLEEAGASADPPREARSRVLHGGRLVSTFTLAEMGELPYDSDVTYRAVSDAPDQYRYLDLAILEHLKEAARHELDCQVCYGLMFDPLTTACGHTFCRECLHRVLDHSSICPICRRALEMPQSLTAEPSNGTLTELLVGLCPDLVAARAEAVARDEVGAAGELDTPLFVCTLSFPSMPTFLHIFEPRYRLMIRRAVESGNRKFGMMMYNRSGEAQGELGPTQFMEYGTLLHIINIEMMPDGRSLIETVGVSRFKVRAWGLRDGYTVANIGRFDDVSTADEERLEAAETSAPPAPAHDLLGQIDRLSTSALLQVGLDFVGRMQATSASWLHERVLEAYGGPPDDPACFPYWFASILPISDEEKYKLLSTTSVRERLKITARWVRRIEAQQW
ncbi:MAG: hypothetical protein M1832_000562 [Thelocarpon impressellum]|nr:MAG: hypothetical protein M1832_000562 [Thelocarpon impressellum]